jgi:predicted acylesterase/phospholipase RssA/CRP-like cAMP-binding protein
MEDRRDVPTVGTRVSHSGTGKAGAFELLEPLEFFHGLRDEVLDDLIRNCDEVTLPAGEVLFRQGDESDALYIVSTGRLVVSLQQEGKQPFVIYEAARGQMVGEMGLLTGETRSASVSSLRDSVLLRLEKDRFEKLLERHPSLTRRIAWDLSRRLKQSNSRVVQREYSVKTFALMPAGEVAPTSHFCQRLLESLSQVGVGRRITRTVVEEAVGTFNPSDTRVINWLDEQEAKFAFLIYETDLGPSEWTSRCIRQADRILAVAPYTNGRGLNEIEAELAQMDRVAEQNGANPAHPRIDLILVHQGADYSPLGTPEWLKARRVEEHYHVSAKRDGDFTRLAKVLMGKAFGLVLSGGGARGFAHIGALQAIEEEGIAIETIGGTSQGALIGAQYAMGMKPEEMVSENRRLFREFRPFKGDKTFPIFSLVTGKTTNRGLQHLFGKIHISDLKIPFFSVAANLSMAKLIVERDDFVWRAIRSSMSLPVLMPPVIKNGQLIVDGGVLNNFPVDVMRQHCNGEVIAVDVSPPVDLLADCEDRHSLGVGDFLRRKFQKKSGAIPHLLEILMRTAFLSSIHHREQMSKYADILIHPAMAGFSLFDWENLEVLVEIGYKETKEELKNWKEQNQALVLSDSLKRPSPLPTPA